MWSTGNSSREGMEWMFVGFFSVSVSCVVFFYYFVQGNWWWPGRLPFCFFKKPQGLFRYCQFLSLEPVTGETGQHLLLVNHLHSAIRCTWCLTIGQQYARQRTESLPRQVFILEAQMALVCIALDCSHLWSCRSHIGMIHVQWWKYEASQRRWDFRRSWGRGGRHMLIEAVPGVKGSMIIPIILCLSKKKKKEKK